MTWAAIFPNLLRFPLSIFLTIVRNNPFCLKILELLAMAAVLQAQVTVSGQRSVASYISHVQPCTAIGWHMWLTRGCRTRGENLWQLAASSLSQEQKELIDFGRSDRLTVLKEVVNLAEDKKEQCIRKRWTIKKRKGGTLILRDVFEKIAVWAQKFREIGDIAVQYDPVHAALPWAGVRLLLQVS